MDYDTARGLFPHLAISVYGYEPGGPVTVEVLAQDGSQFTRQAPTAREALEALFGPTPGPDTTTQPDPVTDEVSHEPDDIFS